MMKPRDNPFAAHRIDALSYRFGDSSWEQLMKDLVRLNYRASIVGARGSGKTTLLEQLGDRLDQEGWYILEIFINEECRWLTGRQWKSIVEHLHKDAIILIDGADLIPRWQWFLVKHLSRLAKGLIIAGHRANNLPVLQECRSSLAILDETLGDLLGSVQVELSQRSHRLFFIHQGNIRDVFRELYISCMNH